MVIVSGHTGVLYLRKQRQMKNLIDQVKLLLKRPTSLQIIASELAEAEMSLLRAETGVEYALSMVTYNKARVKRLKAYVSELSKEV